MRPVVVVELAELVGRVGQVGRQQAGEILRHAVDLLVNVGVDHMAHRAGLERVIIKTGLNKPVGVEVRTSPGVLRQRVTKTHWPIQAVTAHLKVRIAEHKPVKRKGGERLAR